MLDFNICIEPKILDIEGSKRIAAIAKRLNNSISCFVSTFKLSALYRNKVISIIKEISKMLLGRRERNAKLAFTLFNCLFIEVNLSI